MRAEQDIGEGQRYSDAYAKQAFRGVHLLRSAPTLEELNSVAGQLTEMCSSPSELPSELERRSLRAIFAQAYAFATKDIKAAAAAAAAATGAGAGAGVAASPAATHDGQQGGAAPNSADHANDEHSASEQAKAVDKGKENLETVSAAATNDIATAVQEAQEDDSALVDPPFVVEEAPEDDPQSLHTPVSSDKFELGDYAVSMMSRVRLGSRTGRTMASEPGMSDGESSFLLSSVGLCLFMGTEPPGALPRRLAPSNLSPTLLTNGHRTAGRLAAAACSLHPLADPLNNPPHRPTARIPQSQR